MLILFCSSPSFHVNASAELAERKIMKKEKQNKLLAHCRCHHNNGLQIEITLLTCYRFENYTLSTFGGVFVCVCVFHFSLPLFNVIYFIVSTFEIINLTWMLQRPNHFLCMTRERKATGKKANEKKNFKSPSTITLYTVRRCVAQLKIGY